ncbi:MAG: FtsQ-type POTRA domain-containing protein [Acidimicrobiaceae bacterium]|nr:FtsQ-type POTRA domain-containing protein [Acidimicrobiaceae bacterium]
MSSTSVIDPRIRDRRIAVLRARGRRRLRVLLTLLGLTLIATGGWTVGQTELLKLQRMVVFGVDGIDRAEVLQASGLRKGLAMFDFRLADVAEDVETLPWVASAEVRRKWPRTVHISVEPRIPVATVPAEGDTVVLLDSYGYAISRQYVYEQQSILPSSAEDSLVHGVESESNRIEAEVDGSNDFSVEQYFADLAGVSIELEKSSDTEDTTNADDAIFFHLDAPFLFGESLRTVAASELPHIMLPFEGRLGDLHPEARPGLLLITSIPDDLWPWVDAITISSDKEVGLQLVGGATANFSELEFVEDKVAALRALLVGVELDCVIDVDLTMADLVTVRRHPMCPLA